jgi:methionyl-tRNA synthetase
MKKLKPFYITTTLPYVNGKPHIGFATEIIRADIIARYKELTGHEVFFNTGTDEHGQKLLDGALAEGLTPQEYVDGFAEDFKKLQDILGLKDGMVFIRTTDAHHEYAAQEFWKRVEANGYIYKKKYQAKYCVGCELVKTDSETDEHGHCPLHPGKELQVVDEENYFFKFSAFQESLLALYKENPNFVIPEFRLREIEKFVAGGLQDFSISRLKSKMSWGIPVPGDDEHVMYVWFDALVNYISTLKWPCDAEINVHTDGCIFKQFWIDGDTVQYAGKDNLRQQSAMWQAMLMAADLPTTDTVVINGFITADKGIKMSKSLGNTINPLDVVNTYGDEALRYFIARHVHPFDDSPVTMERIHDAYTADLVNGIGNLTARVMKMAETHLSEPVALPPIPVVSEEVATALDAFEMHKATDAIWRQIGELDEYIQTSEPFKVVKVDPEAAQKMIVEMVERLAHIGQALVPFLPKTAEIILQAVKENKKPENMFARIERTE